MLAFSSRVASEEYGCLEVETLPPKHPYSSLAHSRPVLACLVSVDKVDPPLKASGPGRLASSRVPSPFSLLSTHYLATAAKWKLVPAQYIISLSIEVSKS